MKAILQKLAANSGDKKDSLQFRVEEAEVEQSAAELLAMRRFDVVKARFESLQSSIGSSGAPVFESIQFQSVATSLSLSVNDGGIIATITFSVDDPSVFGQVIAKNLRNQVVELSFEPGTNSDAK
jgi:hypothetical protein